MELQALQCLTQIIWYISNQPADIVRENIGEIKITQLLVFNSSPSFQNLVPREHIYTHTNACFFSLLKKAIPYSFLRGIMVSIILLNLSATNKIISSYSTIRKEERKKERTKKKKKAHSPKGKLSVKCLWNIFCIRATTILCICLKSQSLNDCMEKFYISQLRCKKIKGYLLSSCCIAPNLFSV